MKTQTLSLDRISTLPENIIESILILIPIEDALRTSVLSKNWRYTWRNMPKLVFTSKMVKLRCNRSCAMLKKYKLVSAIFHVLMLHNGPKILEFNLPFCQLHMGSEVAQIISYLARGNTVKELNFVATDDMFYRLPVSFFSLQELELIHLENCDFEPLLTFNGFSRLKRMTLVSVELSSQMFHRFISKCPLLVHISLIGYQQDSGFVDEGSKYTFVDLLHCVPLIQILHISNYYMKDLSAGGMPRKLPTSLLHLKHLVLDVCVADQYEVSSALCIIRSSPFLLKISFTMEENEGFSVRQTPANFFDTEDYSDLKLDHLETMEIKLFRKLPLEMEFVKLIMAKSPVLNEVLIKLSGIVSVDEELKMLRDLVLLPFPRASTSGKLIIKRL